MWSVWPDPASPGPWWCCEVWLTYQTNDIHITITCWKTYPARPESCCIWCDIVSDIRFDSVIHHSAANGQCHCQHGQDCWLFACLTGLNWHNDSCDSSQKIWQAIMNQTNYQRIFYNSSVNQSNLKLLLCVLWLFLYKSSHGYCYFSSKSKKITLISSPPKVLFRKKTVLCGLDKIRQILNHKNTRLEIILICAGSPSHLLSLIQA